jgi:YspA, cpYpsA-related SLOG family
MKVCFVGSRNWHDKDKIREVMLKYKDEAEAKGEILTIVSGGARGADSLSVEVAKELDCNTMVYHANWARWGKAAGPIRNAEMIEDSEAVALVAFKKGEKSVGTDHAIEHATKLGIKVDVIPG